MFNDVRAQMHKELDNILSVLEAELDGNFECPQLTVQDTRTLDDGDNVTIYNVGVELAEDAIGVAHTEDRYMTVKYSLTGWTQKSKTHSVATTKEFLARSESL